MRLPMPFNRPAASRVAMLLAVVASLALSAIVTGLTFGQSGGQPVVGISSASYTVSRGDATVTVIITLSQASNDTVTVQWATRPFDPTESAIPGIDFVAASDTAVFPPGTISQQIQIQILPNSQAQDVYFWVDLSNAQNADLGILPAEVTILGSGTAQASVSFDFSSWTYNESDGTATITVTMTGSPTAPVSVTYGKCDGTAQAGVNYSAASGVLTWQPSEAGTSKSFAVTLIDDGTIDRTLTVFLGLTNPVNASLGMESAATLSIMDSDGPCQPGP